MDIITENMECISNLKKCSNCKENKNKKEFGVLNKNKDKLSNSCKL